MLPTQRGRIVVVPLVWGRSHAYPASRAQVPQALVQELAALLRDRAASLVVSDDGSRVRRKEVRRLGSCCNIASTPQRQG